MSYGYNPSALRQLNPDYGLKGPAIAGISPSNKIRNDLATDATSHDRNIQLSQVMHKTVMSHLRTVRKRAEMTNDLAKKRKLPYRLSVYPVDAKVYMDVLIVNEHDEELNKTTREVTNDNFDRLINNISDGSGLLFDN